MEIQHDEGRRRFFVILEGEKAVLDYQMPDSKTLDARHTYVPRALRGRGLAGEIVRFVLEYARENGYRVVPTCSYVAAYIDKNPEYQSLLRQKA